MEEHRRNLSGVSKGKDQPIKAEWSSRCVVFTYFQGDINTVVDEHFSRALRNVKNPQDLSIKNKNEGVILKNANHISQGHINYSPQWTKHQQAAPAMNMSPGLNSPADHYPASVLQSHHSQSPDLWHYPPMGATSPAGQGYHPHSMPAELHMAQGPSPDGKYGSLLSLLQHERCPPSMLEPVMKHEQSSPCAGGPAGSQNMIQSISPQGDIHSQERRKDLYHQQDRRADLYFY
ncbi:transcription cofactor vestigial-like protein 1 [Ambystoma mexicanum]|uniref:transcription cofactor vestigial-like protein 1 n=1 Tax=Ambystoma mexicanum TaxID=8296 RepID=UPI0037E901F7